VGEEAGHAWLEEQGYRIEERNHRNECGEIDVVAWEGEVLCFIEIKARSTQEFGDAIEAVGPRKQRRISRAAALYLAIRAEAAPVCRFDVLGMDKLPEGWRYTLVRNAFEADGVG
jgi:putative endonuclease